MTLSKLKKKQRARIKSLPSDLLLSSRLMEQGFVPNSLVELAHIAPFNGPRAFYLHGTKMSIHQSLAAQIHIELEVA
ncbi:FeoA family protein [Thalassotalea piscium]